MEKLTSIVSIIGILGTVSSIFFAILVFKRNEKHEHRKEGKNEGLILADIGYIKACVDRVEKNLNKLDEKHHDVVERLAKFEEAMANMEKRVDAIILEGGG